MEVLRSSFGIVIGYIVQVEVGVVLCFFVDFFVGFFWVDQFYFVQVCLKVVFGDGVVYLGGYQFFEYLCVKVVFGQVLVELVQGFVGGGYEFVYLGQVLVVGFGDV